MNKFYYLIFTAVIASAFLSGCSGKKELPESASESISVNDVTTDASNSGNDVPEHSTQATEPTSSDENKPLIRDIQPAEGTYIYDYSNILDEAAFSECNDYIEWLYEKYLINAAVVITDDIEGLTPEQYAADAYIEIYEGKGSGLLLLLNNDTNKDYLYKTGGCIVSITEEAQSESFYWATQEIVNGDYKSAILRLMKLGELCSQHILDNGGIFTTENITSLESVCVESSVDISVIATSNSTGIPNEEICRTYYDRHYKGNDGIMIMLDTETNTLTVVSDNTLKSDLETAISEANLLAAKHNYVEAITSIINFLKG